MKQAFEGVQSGHLAERLFNSKLVSCMSKQQQLLGSREKWKRLANIVSRIEQNNHLELSHISRLQYR
jgi:hypothetical protein